MEKDFLEHFDYVDIEKRQGVATIFKFLFFIGLILGSILIGIILYQFIFADNKQENVFVEKPRLIELDDLVFHYTSNCYILRVVYNEKLIKSDIKQYNNLCALYEIFLKRWPEVKVISIINKDDMGQEYYYILTEPTINKKEIKNEN